ncbi:MAG: hypothetical protein GXP62_05650 [Oligoflexia bacterium]|nr:hypothetical protein [Oligoflexia bacterium]
MSRFHITRVALLAALFAGSTALLSNSASAQDDATGGVDEAAAAESGANDKEYDADKGSDALDVSQFPAEQQERYTLFAAKCSKCHTLARPINTDKTASEWARYVKRMAAKPKSNISPDQAKNVYLFLKYYQSTKDAAATDGDAATSE